MGAAAKLLKVFSKLVGSLTQAVEDSVGTVGRCCPKLIHVFFYYFRNILPKLKKDA